MKTRAGPRSRRPSSRRLLALGAIAVLAMAGGGWWLLGGRTSALPAGALAIIEAPDYHSLAFSPSDPKVVFFGHHNGLMRSEDGGRSWRNTTFSGPNKDAMALATNLQQPQLMYLAGHEVFSRSRDGGRSWQEIRDAELPGLDIHAFAMRPDQPERLWAWVVGYGLFRSEDGGRSWSTSGGAPGRLPGDVASLAVLPGDPETVLVGTGRSGLFSSADGGQTWTALSAGPRAAWSLAADGRDRGAVYAASGEALYKSVDRGSTWRRLPFPGRAPQIVAVSPSQPELVLGLAVEQRRGLLYRSPDGGESWGG